MIFITPTVSIPENEVELTAIHAQGSGGQNVNKVATAIHLRFDINASSLPESYKHKLLALQDNRISGDGIINIKAQEFKSQSKNREAAIRRLQALIQQAIKTQKARKPTRPTLTSKQKRLDQKTQRGKTKSLRGRIDVD